MISRALARACSIWGMKGTPYPPPKTKSVLVEKSVLVRICKIIKISIDIVIFLLEEKIDIIIRMFYFAESVLVFVRLKV